MNCVLLFTEGLAPVDLLLLMAAQENDAPRIAELLRAGADVNTKVCFIISRQFLRRGTSSRCVCFEAEGTAHYQGDSISKYQQLHPK